MTARFVLTAMFEPVEGGWVQARLIEIPAVITVAPTMDEARDMLGDAFREYVLSLGGGTGPTPGRGESMPVEVIVGAA